MLYAKVVHMLDGLVDEEMHPFLADHPTIVPLFEIDIFAAIKPYVANPHHSNVLAVLDQSSLKELQQAQDVLDRELAIS